MSVSYFLNLVWRWLNWVFLCLMNLPAESRRRFDEQRGSSSSRGYNYRWQKARDSYLRSHPLCVRCNEQGRIEAASVVDHIQPHKGDQSLFWDQANWQALCKTCHDSYKKRLELSGQVRGCTTDGLPIDPKHHWNRKTTHSMACSPTATRPAEGA